MNPFLRVGAAAVLLVGATAFVTANLVRSQDGGPDDMAAMMAEMEKLARLGPQHEKLGAMAGDWEYQFRFRMGPDAPWMESQGRSKVRKVLGGRYVLEETEMEMMGMPMQGMQLLGFDNLKQEYVSLWADTWSTWWVSSRGKERQDGKIETSGTMVDVAGERPFRMLIEHRPDGSTYSEMFDTIHGAGELKVMEMTARKKG
jgi:hypothetical protein